jgi:hypothetical protein
MRISALHIQIEFHKASFTQWFCYKTLTNGITFVLNSCSLWSNICTKNSLYVKLAQNLWCPMDRVWLPQLWNMEYVTPSKLGGNSTLLATGLTRFFTKKCSTYLRQSLPSCQKVANFTSPRWHLDIHKLANFKLKLENMFIPYSQLEGGWTHPQAKRGWLKPPLGQNGGGRPPPIFSSLFFFLENFT